MNGQEQGSLFEAMGRGDFYPHPVDCIEVRDTHISKVFLTGDLVYKVKKPVDLGFLDFSSLEKRSRCCEAEVALNRRLTQGVYLDVVPICGAPGHYRPDGAGEPIEYAVRMRQLPEDRSLTSLVRRGEAGAETLAVLAERLVWFYDRQGPADPDLVGSAWERVKGACKENFEQTAWAAGVVLPRDAYQIVEAATIAFLDNQKHHFERRGRDGRIRDGHGDLRTGHVYFTGEGDLQIIDCIEFNERLRVIDVASDLAFLAMDLDFEGAPELGAALMDRYAELSGDHPAYALVPFYKAYRAMVRCKVACIRLRTDASGTADCVAEHRDAVRYLELAFGYTRIFSRPTLWVICGIPATGKSTIARGLADALGIEVLRSDVIRKRLFGLEAETPAATAFQRGIYTEKASRATYAEMRRLVAETVDRDRSVILDATFSHREDRMAALRLARDRGITVRFIHCEAPERVVKDRLERRENTASVSDARRSHFDMLKARFSPLDELPPASRLGIDSSEPAADCVRAILSWDYRSRACPDGNGGFGS